MNYAIKKVAKKIKEVLGGKKKDYFDVVEMYKNKKIEEIIRIIMEERSFAQKFE